MRSIAFFEEHLEQSGKVSSTICVVAYEEANGLQFIAIQSSPEIEIFSGFWMLKDLSE